MAQENKKSNVYKVEFCCKDDNDKDENNNNVISNRGGGVEEVIDDKDDDDKDEDKDEDEDEELMIMNRVRQQIITKIKQKESKDRELALIKQRKIKEEKKMELGYS